MERFSPPKKTIKKIQETIELDRIEVCSCGILYFVSGPGFATGPMSGVAPHPTNKRIEVF